VAQVCHMYGIVSLSFSSGKGSEVYSQPWLVVLLVLVCLWRMMFSFFVLCLSLWLHFKQALVCYRLLQRGVSLLWHSMCR
jgi:hypothetical protein